jgi:hypothetical protein
MTPVNPKTVPLQNITDDQNSHLIYIKHNGDDASKDYKNTHFMFNIFFSKIVPFMR